MVGLDDNAQLGVLDIDALLGGDSDDLAIRLRVEAVVASLRV